MKYAAGLLMLAAVLGGCATTGDDVRYVVVQSNPEGATLTFADGDTCQTPCRVGVIKRVEVTVGRTGYKSGGVVLDRNTRSTVTLKLEPVLDDTELEAVELPDIF